MGKDKIELKHKAELIEARIEEAFENGTGSHADEELLDALYYELALIEEELDVMAGFTTELLDNNFDDLDDNDYELLRRVANADD
jgi:hypothetical protein